MEQSTITPPPVPQRKKGCLPAGCLGFAGITLLIIGLIIVVTGIVSGYTEDKAFYQRQDDYHALDDQRNAIIEQCDSIQTLVIVCEEAGDSVGVRRFTQELDSIEATPEYQDLCGTPAPPQGVSFAYVVTIVLCVIAVPFFVVGAILTALWRNRRRPTP